jgi:hypothetical protein
MAHGFLRSSSHFTPFVAGLALAIALSCQASAEKGTTHPRAPVVLTITVSTSGPSPVTVSEPVLVIDPEDAVTLEVRGLTDKYTAEVEFTGGRARKVKDPKTGKCEGGDAVIRGPFPSAPKGTRGRFEFDGQNSSVPGVKPDQCSGTAWPYEVTLRNDGADVYVLDPMIILK